ncbi:MAG: branched-chain amino acid ABC transporter permease [Frankiaceae bacterium]|nr:branched-chain amino acid ABC transporter permease [Frankiaceae bacterium]MBV9369504.1 branched-chain amino acid ABC transporter permease [Frankiales bacterium]
MQVIVVGLIAGCVYALIALGIALVYKATRVLNFAQAEIGTGTLYFTWWLCTRHGLPWIVGALASIAAAIAIGLLFELLVIREMITAPRVTVTVATIGLFSFVLALELAFFAGTIYSVPPPIHPGGVRIGGVFVSWSQWLALGVVCAVALGLAAFLRYTDFGLAVQASADDPVAAQLMGTPRAKISAFTWGTAGALSALAVLLIDPTIGGVLSPGAFSGLFIGGLTAALVGGLNSLPGAFVGGLAVGVVEAEVKAHLDFNVIPSSNVTAMLVIVLAVLLLRPQGLFGATAGRRA